MSDGQWWSKHYTILQRFAAGLEFEDFTFKAIVIGDFLALEGTWREYTCRQAIGPQYFHEEHLLMLVARTVVNNLVRAAMDDHLRVRFVPWGER